MSYTLNYNVIYKNIYNVETIRHSKKIHLK